MQPLPFSHLLSQSVRFRFFEAEIVHVFMFFERFMIRSCVLRRLPAATGAVWESRCLPVVTDSS